jgi:hypothetical protein
MSAKERNFTPQEIAFIKEKVGAIRYANQAGVYGEMAADLSRSLGKHPLQQMELTLRAVSSRAYLIAVPVGQLEDFSSSMPHSGEENYPYVLLVCVNGEREAQERRLALGVTQEENFANLAQAGLLTLKPGTQLARMVRAPLN